MYVLCLVPFAIAALFGGGHGTENSHGRIYLDSASSVVAD